MQPSNRLAFTLVFLGLITLACPSLALAEGPNVVLIYCDDLGYADLGCFGSKICKTPNLDKMAAEGARFTDFYVSSPVCSASRSALLTGAYHERLGIRGALGPKDKKGLNHLETTIAELLKAKGYATGMAGKWHLGCRPSQLPVHHGFDEFLGIPYSNDMWPNHPETPKSYPPLPLIEGDRPLIASVTPDDQREFTTRFADRAIAFIRTNKDRPFFFYLAPNMPHVPLFVSKSGEGKTGRGLYADVIAEIDNSVGKILSTLKELNLDEKTLVIFASDNGPWLSYGDHSGSAGPLREGKGTTYEGGIRVPMIARWPGQIPAGTTCREPAGTIDILPTIAALTQSPLPSRPIDGKDITPLLRGTPEARSPHDALFFYYGDGQLQAMRSGRWKLLFPHTSRTMIGQPSGQGGTPGKYKPLTVGLELYDLETDLGETRNLATTHPEVVRDLQAKADVIRSELGDSLKKKAGSAVRPGEPGDRLNGTGCLSELPGMAPPLLEIHEPLVIAKLLQPLQAEVALVTGREAVVVGAWAAPRNPVTPGGRSPDIARGTGSLRGGLAVTIPIPSKSHPAFETPPRLGRRLTELETDASSSVCAGSVRAGRRLGPGRCLCRSDQGRGDPRVGRQDLLVVEGSRPHQALAEADRAGVDGDGDRDRRETDSHQRPRRQLRQPGVRRAQPVGREARRDRRIYRAGDRPGRPQAGRRVILRQTGPHSPAPRSYPRSRTRSPFMGIRLAARACRSPRGSSRGSSLWALGLTPRGSGSRSTRPSTPATAAARRWSRTR